MHGEGAANDELFPCMHAGSGVAVARAVGCVNYD
jgi:hypothetical protein